MKPANCYSDMQSNSSCVRVALYARCSTKKQDLDSQLEALKRWAEQQGHEVIAVYQDLAVSGRKDNRQGINRLLADARQNKFELVGVVELSRIGRSIKFIHGTVEELSSLGIKVVLTNSNTSLDYNSLEGRALIGGLSLAADIEWMLIQERNARGRDAIRERGIRVGRKHKEVSIVVLKALQEKGMSLRQIAMQLGVSAPTVMRRLSSTLDKK